jgi:hypothetical protein
MPEEMESKGAWTREEQTHARRVKAPSYVLWRGLRRRCVPPVPLRASAIDDREAESPCVQIKIKSRRRRAAQQRTANRAP